MSFEIKESRTAPGYKVVGVNCDVIVNSGVAGPRSQWGVWSAHWQEGREKPSKKPYGGDGHLIGTNDPEKWLSFDDARKLYEAGGYDGVGVLLSSLVGFIGIDLDDCLDDSGHARPESKELVNAFLGLGGYMERSPSGKGLRQFIKGSLPSGYKEKAAWGETYDYRSTRYLTLTGAVWPDWQRQAGAVIENQKGLDAFMSQFGERRTAPKVMQDDGPEFGEVRRTAVEVLGLLRRHNKQGKVTRLLAGDTGDHAGDHSAADLELCCQAAYFCRDPAVIDEVMRGSGLMRPKWDGAARAGESYGEGTIREALDRQQRNYDIDQAEKKQAAGAAKEYKERLKKTGSDFLIGGIADLMTSRNHLKTDIWALSELLARDRRLIGCVHFDEFAGFPVFNRSLRDAMEDASATAELGRIHDDHILSFIQWFGRVWGLPLKLDQVKLAVGGFSQRVRLNPVSGILDDLKWDGRYRLDAWLVDYLKASTVCGDGRQIGEYVRAVGAKWLISAVARAYKPGSKADCMLVLEGQQGARKSSAVRVLTEAVGAEYFREGFHLGGTKDDQLALRGRLIIEWGELSGMGKKDRNELKVFLSQQADSYRQGYAIFEKDWPRTAVFVGTTNDSGYLADPSGGRRFWPVTVGRADLDRLRRDAPQLWAEAVHRYKAGERWWFDDDDPRDQRLLAMAQSEQQKRVGSTFWGEVAAELADKLVGGNLVYMTKADELTTAQPWEKFNRGQMTVWLSQCAVAVGVVAGAADLDGEKVVRIDDRNWLKVVEGLKLAGWESSKSNGYIKWSLTPERREALCRQHGLDVGPKIGPMKRAAREGRGGAAAAANDSGISQCEMPKNRGEASG